MKAQLELVLNGYVSYLEDPGTIKQAYKHKKKEPVVGGILPGVEPPSVELEYDVSWTAENMIVVMTEEACLFFKDLFRQGVVMHVIIVDGLKKVMGSARINRFILIDCQKQKNRFTVELDLFGLGELIDL